MQVINAHLFLLLHMLEHNFFTVWMICVTQMFSVAPNGSQNQQNVDGQRHCILVAASNPHPLPTPVYRPQMQNLDQNENNEAQAESRLSDAETVAKSFVQVLIYCSSSFY